MASPETTTTLKLPRAALVQPTLLYSEKGYENLPVTIYSHSRDACLAVAAEIRDTINHRSANGKTCVLGLATGSTPIGVYRELVRMHEAGEVSFRNVITFNLDEYFPMEPYDLQSYVRFMHEHLFDCVDIPPESIHIPDGRLPVDQIPEYCQEYEDKIRQVGGIDFQLLGIGRTGHIGFNEPGSGRRTRTRLITLDKVTRTDAASDFFGIENVPRRAITMGIGTVLEAKRVILLAFGEHKSSILAQAVEGEVDANIPASQLQDHQNIEVIADQAASVCLTRVRAPWLLGSVKWGESIVPRAVIWLSQLLKKPILKLTDEDYNENGLQDLLADRGPAYNINIEVFRRLQSTITGWPGGKPSHRRTQGEQSDPHDDVFPKRVLVFSPHPDDDVISMGGTLIRLVDQGHEVHVAYQTSGNIAVTDDDALRYAEFTNEYLQHIGVVDNTAQKTGASVEELIINKHAGDIDPDLVRNIKALIRRSEARAAARSCGVSLANIHFLDLPFYETGVIKKNDLSEADVQITGNLLHTIQPHQIYAAGDLTDPHGTHRTCLAAITNGLEQCRKQDWYPTCEVWLYRGAWQEWNPEDIEMAVPLSPGELDRKRQAIFKHESQKDRAMFPGLDMREFWQRAEDRNRRTAKLYDQLGLAEYEAIEGFVRWHSHHIHI